jgi:molybdate transport system substrate-binding protein
MRHQLARAVVLAILAIAWPAGAWAGSITVSAAISLHEALTRIASLYQKQSGQTVTLNFGASGALAEQISQGAPVDVFISAGVKEMDELAKQGLIDKATRRVICRNQLVLIVPSDASFVPTSFSQLTDSRVGRLAIGQPQIVPAGRYAKQVLVNLKIYQALEPKLVLGENVRQVLDYVERGEVDAGVVYSTDAVEAGAQVRVAARADPSLHQPIVYPAAVIKESKAAKSAAAAKFLAFLDSQAAQRILIQQGFLIHLPTSAPAP